MVEEPGQASVRLLTVNREMQRLRTERFSLSSWFLPERECKAMTGHGYEKWNHQ
jgi:hypothetical protein